MYFDNKIKLSYILLHAFTKATLKNSIFEYASSLLTLTLKRRSDTWEWDYSTYYDPCTNVFVGDQHREIIFRRSEHIVHLLNSVKRHKVIRDPHSSLKCKFCCKREKVDENNSSIHPSIWLIIALRALKITTWKFL